MTGAVSPLLHAGAAAVCLVWAALVLGVGRNRAALLPAAACAGTALWAGVLALTPEAPLTGPAGVAEILRNGLWLVLLVALCRRAGGPRAAPLARRFAIGGGIAAALTLAALLPAAALSLPTLGSPALLARLGLALLMVLLAENLYRNADEAARWHVNLPAIALGGLSVFDVLLYADAALHREFSPALLDARAALAALAMPLLALAAVRDRRWRRDLPVSREVVFHGATLVVAGAFLLGVGAAGEALRHLGADWARAAQVSLLAGAVMVLAVAAASRTVRSRVRRLVVDHFFAARYDYRREWLRCVAALSASDAEAPAPVRAIRAVADAVDSPAGVLLLREPGEAGLHWAGSWNLPTGPLALPGGHPLLAALREGAWVAELGAAAPADLRAAYGPLWLGVPLLHHREGLLGAVLLAPPRAPFPLDGEVFDLLRTLGREVAMFLAERRAAERLADQRQLQDYAKRFAFVAHDVKTVASQLTLLLANADENIEDPEFQRDMLLTVRASADRINALIARLRQPGDEPLPGPAEAAVAPLARLRALAAARAHPVALEEEGAGAAEVAMAPERFDAAVTHLLDNAIEASAPGEPVRIRLRQEGGRVVVDIIDRGEGMTPEFIRDELFRPLSTSKPRGSGIGAWQARELLREAGGDLTVLSRPGAGTTMRLTLPVRPGSRAGAAPLAAAQGMPA
ncbi:XrtA/PEP-CTERM system histidine kinase PrsK [Crenalkalicoccus roseus]|uniref:XrtA/PEP-CTERM system histidine kinase PrsK n=1 Tax=Crenalkalicoccus roseus TaxID=1485588 RepID=UPI001082127E|nr:XrtA/PEP-CTERM system histidine kinase PrsK [Crenalkalicoccus roseus]